MCILCKGKAKLYNRKLFNVFLFYYNKGYKGTPYSTGFKKIDKINATAPQPQRNVLKYFSDI